MRELVSLREDYYIIRGDFTHESGVESLKKVNFRYLNHRQRYFVIAILWRLNGWQAKNLAYNYPTTSL